MADRRLTSPPGALGRYAAAAGGHQAGGMLSPPEAAGLRSSPTSPPYRALTTQPAVEFVPLRSPERPLCPSHRIPASVLRIEALLASPTGRNGCVACDVTVPSAPEPPSSLPSSPRSTATSTTLVTQSSSWNRRTPPSSHHSGSHILQMLPFAAEPLHFRLGEGPKAASSSAAPTVDIALSQPAAPLSSPQRLAR
jgi:hypothetical protein